ncbi:hypothetical protein MA16_Dca020148 [Dendrobium catenatum]|uniref:Uncharacterized protein n=1 Tax=Dendrobium catenatum TaxID=906689 RepID=A0A2I0WEW4_9ASPA|nr:hypothetical protein MA16_Dca020148 [Dendrobium catenatum]
MEIGCSGKMRTSGTGCRFSGNCVDCRRPRRMLVVDSGQVKADDRLLELFREGIRRGLRFDIAGGGSEANGVGIESRGCLREEAVKTQA